MDALTVKKKEIDEIFNNIIANTSEASSKRVKLIQFNKVCEEVAKKGAELQITTVVSYITSLGIKISKQSIYNKQGGKNPYRQLFDHWLEYSSIKRSVKKAKISKSKGNEILTESDLSKIDDPVLKYRISLAFGELKGLKKQNDMLRNINEVNSIASVPMHEIELKDADDILLNSYEVELVKSLCDGDSNITFDENGSLIAKTSIKRGTPLSAEGFKDALKKIIKSYKVS